jgi:hypothetical protein
VVNPNDEALAALRERHPGWQVWRVDRFIGAPLWCARPQGQTRPVLNAPTPQRLTELIKEQEAGLPRPGTARAGPPRASSARELRAQNIIGHQASSARELRAQNIIGHQGAGSQDSAADSGARVPGRSSSTSPAAAIGPSRVPPR